MIPSTLPWAAERIRAGQAEHGAALPRYGSPEWNGLPPGSAARWAAVVLAAEAWRTDLEITVAEIEADRLAGIAAAERAADAEFARQAASIRAMANTPTYAELKRRRAEVTVP